MTDASASASRVAHVSLAAALVKGPPPPGSLAVPIFAHGSLEVELYSPQGRDLQKPHSRDEVYLVVAGEALLFDGESLSPVQRGSFIFGPTGQEHRFLRGAHRRIGGAQRGLNFS